MRIKLPTTTYPKQIETSPEESPVQFSVSLPSLGARVGRKDDKARRCALCLICLMAVMVPWARCPKLSGARSWHLDLLHNCTHRGGRVTMAAWICTTLIGAGDFSRRYLGNPRESGIIPTPGWPILPPAPYTSFLDCRRRRALSSHPHPGFAVVDIALVAFPGVSRWQLGFC